MQVLARELGLPVVLLQPGSAPLRLGPDAPSDRDRLPIVRSGSHFLAGRWRGQGESAWGEFAPAPVNTAARAQAELARERDDRLQTIDGLEQAIVSAVQDRGDAERRWFAAEILAARRHEGRAGDLAANGVPAHAHAQLMLDGLDRAVSALRIISAAASGAPEGSLVAAMALLRAATAAEWHLDLLPDAEDDDGGMSRSPKVCVPRWTRSTSNRAACSSRRCMPPISAMRRMPRQSWAVPSRCLRRSPHWSNSMNRATGRCPSPTMSPWPWRSCLTAPLRRH